MQLAPNAQLPGLTRSAGRLGSTGERRGSQCTCLPRRLRQQRGAAAPRRRRGGAWPRRQGLLRHVCHAPWVRWQKAVDRRLCRCSRRSHVAGRRLISGCTQLGSPPLQVLPVAAQQVHRQPAVQQVARRLQFAARGAGRHRALARSCISGCRGVQSDEQVGLCAAAVCRHRQAHPLQLQRLWQQVLQLGNVRELPGGAGEGGCGQVGTR